MESIIEQGYLNYIYTDILYLIDNVETEKNVVEGTEEVKEISKTEVVSVPKLKTTPVPALPKLEKLSDATFKKCMLLYSSEDDKLNESELEFCASIMKACGLKEGEYICVNFNGITINDLKERYEFKKLLLFGVEIPKLTIDKYKCTLVNTTYIISSDPLWMLQKNKELKSFLWTQLQLMFGLVK